MAEEDLVVVVVCVVCCHYNNSMHLMLQVVATVCSAPPYGHRKSWIPRTPQVCCKFE